jgi:predicted exporter
LVVFGMLGWLAWKLTDEVPISADLMALLPSAERDPAIDQAASRFRQEFERRVVFLVAASDLSTARPAADYLLERLADTRQFRSLRLRRSQDELSRIGAFYFPYRFQLLSERTREQLRRGDWSAFEQDLVARYYAPGSLLTSALIESDPLLLLPGFLGERAGSAPGALKLEDGYLSATLGERTHVLLSAELAASPFSLAVQDRLAPVIEALRGELQDRFPGASLMVAGVLPHAVAGTARAQVEMSTVGLGSTLGVVLLFQLVFRSWRPLALSLGLIVVGCVGGFAACLAVFGHVHLLTLVFGASLVGISVDYALHYFCEYFRLGNAWSPQAALRHIFPGITLGLITSVIGFAGLFIAPFPGLQEMAVFSSTGLLFTYGCVVAWFPLLTKTPLATDRSRLLEFVGGYARLWRRRPARLALAGAALALGLLCVGWLRLEVQDDIRLFQALDPDVLAEQEQIRSVIGRVPAAQFFLVEGRDSAELLEREEALTAKLRALERKRVLGSHMAMSDAVPSPARQAENRKLLASLIGDDGGTLKRLTDSVGLKAPLLQSYLDAFAASGIQPPLSLAQWLDDPLSDDQSYLWLGPSDRGVIAAVSLDDVRDPGTLRALQNPEQGVHFVDNVADLSELFAQHRRTTTILTLASYALVTLILQIRYGFRGGLIVMAAPALAAVASLGVLGLLGQPLSLFNVMALLLVLGISVDYGLFYRETGAKSESTMLAIMLSAVTTILSFGLLAFSSTAAIQAFGLTVMIGIGVAVLVSPLAGKGKPAITNGARV